MGKHFRLGGSITKRFLECPSCIPLTERDQETGLIPAEQESNFSADKGTAAHTLGEKCLETGCDPIDYMDVSIRVGSNKFLVDHHMVRAVSVYVDECRAQYAECGETSEKIEFRTNLKSLVGEDAGGPCDYCCWGKGLLVVIDYKNGTQSVEVDGNDQLFTYSLGVYEELKSQFKIDRLRTIIVQPNADHPEGPIRSRTYPIKDLRTWARKRYKPGVKRVQKATEIVLAGDTLPSTLQPNAGEWCYFCPRSGICEANMGRQALTLKSEFNDLELPLAHTLTVEEAEKIILAKKQIHKFIEEVETLRKHSLKQGESSDHFKLVEAKGNLKFLSKRKVKRRLTPLLGEQQLYTSKLKPVGELETLIYKVQKAKDKSFTRQKAKDLLDSVTFRPSNGETMVPVEDKREAICISAKADFAET